MASAMSNSVVDLVVLVVLALAPSALSHRREHFAGSMGCGARHHHRRRSGGDAPGQSGISGAGAARRPRRNFLIHRGQRGGAIRGSGDQGADGPIIRLASPESVPALFQMELGAPQMVTSAAMLRSPRTNLGRHELPRPGRLQVAKAEAARRGRDSASLYGLPPARSTAAGRRTSLRGHRTSSNSGFGGHPTGSAIQRLMSDSCQPVPLVLILS